MYGYPEFDNNLIELWKPCIVGTMYQTIHGFQSSIRLLSNSGYPYILLLYLNANILFWRKQFSWKINVHLEKVSHSIHHDGYYSYYWYVDCRNQTPQKIQCSCGANQQTLQYCPVNRCQLGFERLHSYLITCLPIDPPDTNGPTYITMVGECRTYRSSINTAGF